MKDSPGALVARELSVERVRLFVLFEVSGSFAQVSTFETHLLIALCVYLRNMNVTIIDVANKVC